MSAPAAAPGVEIVATKLHAPDVNKGFVPRDLLVVRLASGVTGGSCSSARPPAGARRCCSRSGAVPSAATGRSRGSRSIRPTTIRCASGATSSPRCAPSSRGSAAACWPRCPTPGRRSNAVVLPRLINELAALPEPVVLVLDDYHELRDELVHASMAYLLQHAPPNLQIAIATRADPPLGLARLRAAGELVEIRAGELQFGAGEAEALLNDSMALGLAPADVSLLQARTEGWPAGLRLAALSLRGVEDRAAFIRSLRGRRPPGRRLPARGARDASRRGCASSCCARRSSSGCARRCARRSSATTTRRRCWPRRTARTCSWSRSTTASTGSASTTCCATCSRASSRRASRLVLRDLHGARVGLVLARRARSIRRSPTRSPRARSRARPT